MTDKQIIIDKLKNDVACKENIINHLAEHTIKLQNQLKRKEQECERLKEEVSLLKESNSKLQQIEDVNSLEKCYLQQLDQLKAENEQLKTMLKDLSYENQKFCYQIEEQTKQLEPFKDEYFKGLDNVAIAKLAKKSIRITAENSKLEQTLAEIKEICNSVENIENINSLYDAKLSGMYLQANKILQKISECGEIIYNG